MSGESLERTGAWVLAATLAVVPLVYGSALADPFALVKRSVMLVALLILAGLALAARPTGSPQHLHTKAQPLALLLLVSAALASALAANTTLAVWGLLDLAVGCGLFAATLRFARSAWSVSLVLRAALLGAAAAALGSLFQVLLPPAVSGWLGPLLPPNRGGSTLGDPGLICQVLIVALPLGIGAAALSASAWRQTCGGLLGVLAAAIIFAGRPEGWWVAGGALALVIIGRVLQAAGHGGRWSDLVPDFGGAGLRSFLIAGIVVLASVSLSRLAFLYPSSVPPVPLQGTSLLTPTTGNASADRAAAVPATLRLIARHPLGVGPAQFRHAFLEVAWTAVPRSPFSLSHQAVHPGNAYLEMTAETGILGGLAFALLVLLLLVQAALAALRADAPWDTAGTVALGGLGGLAAAGLFGGPFQEPTPWLYFWVTAGIVQVALARAPSVPRLLARLQPREAAPRGPARASRTAAAALALAATGLVLLGLTLERVRASMWTLRGQGAFYAAQYRAALQAFDQPVVLRSPEHLPRVLAGSSGLRLGLYDDAIREFGATLRRSPHFISAYLGRAAAEEAKGLWDMADADYQAALAIWPGNGDIYMALANLDTTRGRLDAALEDYRQVMQINPGQAEAYFRMGEIFLRRNQIDEAIEAFRVCGTKDPKYPNVRLRLGDAFFQKGLQEMALRYYEAEAAEDPKDVQARLRIANAMHALGQYCNARDALTAARDLETDTAKRDGILDLIRKIQPDCDKESGVRRK